MSRILEAVKRAEQERARGGAQRAATDVAVMDLLLQAQTQARRREPGFSPLAYHPDPEHLRAGQDDPDSQVAAERFRQLRYRLDAWRATQTQGVLLVTSAIPGEGKTLVATNLAETLARASGRVLLVDADMRRPGVAPALGLEALPGLAEILRGELGWREACRSLEPLGFDYLPAGKAHGRAAELLHCDKLKQLVDDMAPGYDWVIIDSAPLAPFADSLYLAAASRGVLLVTRERFTPCGVFKSVLDSLRDFPVVGIVLNAVTPGARDHYYYDYYRDGAEEAGAEVPAAAVEATRSS